MTVLSPRGAEPSKRRALGKGGKGGSRRLEAKAEEGNLLRGLWG